MTDTSPPPVAVTPPAPDSSPDPAVLVPIASLRRRWPTLLAAALTLAMVTGLGIQLLEHGVAGFSQSLPTSPFFYLFFLIFYFALPVADFIIYRRLWGISLNAFPALNRKRIANEVLLGYTGDAYFYAWARARLKMVAAPFGAVKDTSIVSGIAGNLLTVLLSAVALPLGWELISPATREAMLWSLSIPLLVSIALLAFSRRVFSLARHDLLFIFWIDIARHVVNGVALAIAWAYAMPSVGLGMWMFLVTARLLVFRLPLVPNKDLLFANFAILLIGQDDLLSNLIAFTAASTLLVHVLLMIGFGVANGAERTRAWYAER